MCITDVHVYFHAYGFDVHPHTPRPPDLWPGNGARRELRVHYSDRLVALLREVRQLAVLGLPRSASTAQKFTTVCVCVCVCVCNSQNTLFHTSRRGVLLCSQLTAINFLLPSNIMLHACSQAIILAM